MIDHAGRARAFWGLARRHQRFRILVAMLSPPRAADYPFVRANQAGLALRVGVQHYSFLPNYYCVTFSVWVEER